MSLRFPDPEEVQKMDNKVQQESKEMQTKPRRALDYAVLNRIAQYAHYYAMQMINIANNREDVQKGDPKVGGHPAASASALHILGALHLVVKSPFDHLAVKPHASPADHAYNYLLHNLFKHLKPSTSDLNETVHLERLSDEEQVVAMRGLRHFSQQGEPVFQSYHSGWDPDGLNFLPSGSVGIPPVNAAYLAHAYRFATEHGYDVPKDAHFWALMGDSEFREGSLAEVMPECAEREIGNLTWIIDYNRQSLDGQRITNRSIMNGTDAHRIERAARANGWDVIQLEHGKLREEAFQLPGGDLFRKLLEENLDDYELQSMLQARDAKAIRQAFIEKEPRIKEFLMKIKDNHLVDLLKDMGGHCFERLIEAMEKSKEDKNRPTLIIAHTVKGWGLRCQAVSGNHSILPEEDEINELRDKLKIPAGEVFKRPDANSDVGLFVSERGDAIFKGYQEQIALKERNRRSFLKQVQASGGLPESQNINLKLVPIAHTQWMLGQLTAKLTRIANTPLDESKLKEGQRPLGPDEKRWKLTAELFMTMAPDVGTSTNLNPAMDGKIFGPEIVKDYESLYHVKDTKTPDIVPAEEPSHRHLRFEIAEGNAMSCVGSYGKMREITGVPLIPMMTVYDFFIKRALDQLFYNLYWGSSFILVGTPAGITLSPEGAQHGWKSDIQIPNQITWEPFFAIELDWILSESVRRHLEYDNQGRSGVIIRGVTRGIEQAEMLKRLRKHTRFLNQDGSPKSDAEILSQTRSDLLSGGYYLVDWRGYEGYEPGDNVVNIFAMGALGTEALRASDILLEKGIYANVIMVSSPDLMLGNLAHENNYQWLREGLGIDGNLHLMPQNNGNGSGHLDVPDVVTLAGRRVPAVSVHDGEPGLLDNIGSIVGVKHIALATRHHSKSGRPTDIYRYHNIDGESVAEACGQALTETALENIAVSRQVLEQAVQQQETVQTSVGDLWPQGSGQRHSKG